MNINSVFTQEILIKCFQAYAKGARMYGATLVQDTPVTGTKQLADGSWEVKHLLESQ